MVFGRMERRFLVGRLVVRCFLVRCLVERSLVVGGVVERCFLVLEDLVRGLLEWGVLEWSLVEWGFLVRRILERHELAVSRSQQSCVARRAPVDPGPFGSFESGAKRLNPAG